MSNSGPYIDTFDDGSTHFEWVWEGARFWIVFDERPFWGYTHILSTDPTDISTESDYFTDEQLKLLSDMLSNEN